MMARRSPAGRSRWLAAVALPCSDPVGLNATGQSVLLYASSHFHWRINIFDSAQTSCVPWAAEATEFLQISHLPGYMTIFWKRVLVPSLTRQYDRIFIMDNDVRLTPQLGFSPRLLDRWFERTGASILQPSVIASEERGRSGTGIRNHHAFTADCAAHQIGSPERVYVALPAAYEVLWRLLQEIPDERLATDTGLLSLWTKLTCIAIPRRPPCVLLNSVQAPPREPATRSVAHPSDRLAPSRRLARAQVVHFDTKTISKAGLDPLYNDPRVNKRKNVLFYLWDHPQYGRLTNGSYNPYPEHECGVVASSVSDLGLDGTGKPMPLKTQRQKAEQRRRVRPTCWGLLDDGVVGRTRKAPNVDGIMTV